MGQASVAAQEAFFVSVHDGHKAHLWQVQPLPKKVDPHQHVDGAVAQFAQDFHAVEGFHVRVNVPALDAQAVEVFGQFLGHAFGQCGHEHALVVRQRLPDFHDQIVDLMVAWTHVNGRVQQSSGANDLFHDHAFGTLQFVVRGGRRDVNGLVDDSVEFFVGQRAVVQGGGQAESVVDEGHFAGAVSAKHRPELGHRDVALVNHHKKVFGEVIQQAEGTLARLPTVEVPRIVFNSGAKPDFLDHLKVVQRSLVQTFGLEEPRLLVEEGFLFLEVLLNLPNGGVGRLLAADKEVGRVDVDALKGVELLAALRVNRGQPFDFVVPKLHPYSVVSVGQMDVHRVAFDPKIPAFEVAHRSAVQAGHEAVKQVVSSDALPHLKSHDIFVKLHGVANAVDAADARDHDDVSPPTEQGRGGRQSQFFNFVVDLKVLLDVGVRRRNERLRLVVIVVADEVLDEVVGEKGLELAVQLSRQGFVVAQNQGGALGLGDDVRHGERFSRTGDPEQNLVFVAFVHAFHQLSNRLRLISRGLEWTVEFERAHGPKVRGRGRERCATGTKCCARKNPAQGGAFQCIGCKDYSATTSNLTVTTTSL